MRMKLFFVLPVFLSFLFFESYAQNSSRKNKKIEIVHANTLRFDKNLGNGAKRLIGDVQFKHEDMLMFCDSAYFYEDNSLDAFGRIHIQQGDSLHIYGDFLKYNGDTKKAIINRNVVVDKGDMHLYTDILNYDVSTRVGYYNTAGRIINKDNVLTSNQGYYYSKTNDCYFKKNVLLHNPQFIVDCDTMRYNSGSKIAYFIGPTNIKSKENTIYCEDGYYDTSKDLSRFSKNSYILTKKQKMSGDSIYYDRKKKIGRAVKNVKIVDPEQKLTIKGKHAIHYEIIDLSVVTGNVLLMKRFEEDTLFLHADTLKALGNTKEMNPNKDSLNKDKTLFAYHKVKFFKSDLQGKCDSLIYTTVDSILKMYGRPIMWSDIHQLTADSISATMGTHSIKYMELKNDAFIVSEEDTLMFNQMRGKYMKGFFKKNDLYRVNVEGNGQTIYYVKEDEKISAVNRTDCSDLHIYVANKEVDKITFLTKPESTMYPINQVKLSEFRLKGFSWRIKERPLNSKDIFKWIY